MSKPNHLRVILQSFQQEQLVELCEKFARSNKLFEAFLLENSSEVVATHKSLDDYRSEVEEIITKATGRSKKIKITRLERAGLKAFAQMSESNLVKGNLQDALFMNLSLMEGLMNALVANAKSTWNAPPVTKLVKYLSEVKDRFDSALKIANPTRQNRQPILRVLLFIWLNQHLARQLSAQIITTQTLLAYAPNDDDQIYLQLLLKEQMPALQQEAHRLKTRSGWRYLIPGQFETDHPIGRRFAQVVALESHLKKLTSVES